MGGEGYQVTEHIDVWRGILIHPEVVIRGYKLMSGLAPYRWVFLPHYFPSLPFTEDPLAYELMPPPSNFLSFSLSDPCPPLAKTETLIATKYLWLPLPPLHDLLFYFSSRRLTVKHSQPYLHTPRWTWVPYRSWYPRRQSLQGSKPETSAGDFNDRSY